MSKVNLGDAINRVCEEIKNDKQYRISWEANIAMAFKDAFDFSGYKHDNKAVHEVANKAAAAFLDQLIGKDVGGVDGIAAIAKLHQQAKPLTYKINNKEIKKYLIKENFKYDGGDDVVDVYSNEHISIMFFRKKDKISLCFCHNLYGYYEIENATVEQIISTISILKKAKFVD